MSQYNVTISIVSYNSFKDVKKAIETLEEYTNPIIKKQIYVIDNANEQEQYATIPGIEYIHTGKNLGFGAGHNVVLEKLDSDYHIIMNPDILFIEDSIPKLIEYMNAHLDVGMCVPKLVNEKNKRISAYRNEVTVFDMFIRMFTPHLFKKRQEKHSLQSQDFSVDFSVPFVQGSFLFIRTELLKNLNGFDDSYFMYMEDADLCKRINQISCVKYVPDTTIIHKWEQGSHKSFKLFRYHVKSMFRYFNKWGWKWI